MTIKNLIVAYDLIPPGQNYELVRSQIKSLGRWYQLQYSLFYLSTHLSAEQAHDLIRLMMDPNDKLLVVEALAGKVSFYPQADLDLLNLAWLASGRIVRAA